MPLIAWTRSQAETVALPIDALALLVLQDYVDGNGWNWQNWMRESEQYGTARDPETGLALSEAWSWLITHGLVVRDPSQSSSDAYNVSRLGRETLQYGVARLAAAARSRPGERDWIEVKNREYWRYAGELDAGRRSFE